MTTKKKDYSNYDNMTNEELTKMFFQLEALENLVSGLIDVISVHIPEADNELISQWKSYKESF